MKKTKLLNRTVAFLLAVNLILSVFSGGIMQAYAAENGTDPTEVTTTPTEESVNPVNEDVTDPTDEATEPTGDATDPTDEATDPTDEATDPTDEATDPTDEVTDPTDEVTDPTDAATDPTEDETEPTEDDEEPEDSIGFSLDDVDVNTFTATLYNEGSASGTAVELTTDGGNELTLSDAHNLMVINWRFDQDEIHTLDITVPAGMYIVSNSWSTADSDGDFEKVEFFPLDLDPDTAGYQQGTGNYYNTQTGTLRYTTVSLPNLGEMIPTAEVSITLQLAYDTTLWDKAAGYYIDADGNKIGLTGKDSAVVVTEDAGKSDEYSKRLDHVAAPESIPYTVHTFSVKDIVPQDDPQSPYNFYRSADNQGTYYYAFAKIVNEYTLTVTGAPEGSDPSLITLAYIDYTDRYPNVVAKATIESVRDDAGRNIVVTLTDVGQNGANGLSYGAPYFIVPAGANLNGCKLTLTIKSTMTSYSGRVTTTTGSHALYVPQEGPVLVVSNAGRTITNDANFYGTELATVESIGGWRFSNTGLGAATDVPVTYEFDIDNSGVRVYGINAQLPSNQTTTAQIMLVDDNGTLYGPYSHVLTGRTEDVNGAWVSAQMIANENNLSGQYYLKKISYIIPEILGGVNLYSTGGLYGFASGGATVGRMVGTFGRNSLTLYKGVEGKELSTTMSVDTLTSKSKLTNSWSVYNLTGTVVNAGQSAEITFSIQQASYPYANTTYTQNPTVVFSTPRGISVDKLTYTDRNTGKSYTVLVTEANKAIDNNNTLYIIPLGEEADHSQAYVSNDGKLVTNTLGYNIQLVLSADVNGTVLGSYAARPRLAITDSIDMGDGTFSYSNSGLSGAYKKYTIEDLYDIDNDGNITEKLATASADKINAFVETIPATNGFTVQAGISKDGTTYITGTSDDRTLTTRTGDNFYYRLLVTNQTGAEIPRANNAIYIPILEPGQTLPVSMSGSAPAVGARLKGPVSITGTDVWDIRYSYDATKDNFSNSSADFTSENGEATWHTAAEVAASNSWHLVTMVKAVIKEDHTFPVDGSSQLVLTMAAQPVEPGTTALWSSAVWSQYRNGDANDTNNGQGYLDNTAYTRIKTATKKVNDPADTTPDDTGEDSHYILHIATGTTTDPQEIVCGQGSTTLLDLGHVIFHAYDAQGKNLTLVKASELKQNLTSGNLPSVTEQDQTFAMEVSFNNGGTWIDIYGASANDHFYVGDTAEAAETPVLFRIYHYSSFIDVSTDRYIQFFIRDEMDSLESTLEIHIDRTLSLAEAKTGIAPGEIYGNIGTEVTSVTIAQNSAFTAQFVVNGFVSENYQVNESKLTFSNAIPAGTRLILIDQSVSGSPKFYSLVSSSNTSSILLSQFKEVQGSATFVLNEGENNLLLLADFQSAPISNGFDMTLNVPLETGKTGDPINSVLKVSISGNRTFAMAAANGMGNELVSEMKLSYTLSSGIPGGYDAFWVNRQQALIFKLNDGKTFPAGSYIQYGSGQYSPSEDGSYILVPIGEVSASATVELALCTPYVKLADGTYSLTADRWISATADPSNPMGGTKEGTVTTQFTVRNTGVQRALRLDMGADRIVTIAEAQTGIALSIERANIASTEGLKLVVEQKSASGAYSTHSTFNSITGASYTAMLSNVSYGTYRFVLSYGNEVVTTLEFIIVES